MTMKTYTRPAIAITAAVVVAMMLYLAWGLTSRPDEVRVVQLIDERLAPPTRAGASSAPLDEARVVQLIEERVPRVKGGAISDKEFNIRVEQGIVAFIEKQQRAEQGRPQQLARNVPPPTKDDHLYGNPQAPITLIEYSDYECPYCKRFHPTATQLVDRSNGQVNWVYRHFPLEFHNPGAQRQAEATECAAELGGNDAFWRYSDAIYARTTSGGKGFALEKLTPLAVELGLDNANFQECLDSGRYAKKVQKQMAEGQRAGVNGTPGNILYHRKTGKVTMLSGAVPFERLQQAVKTLIEQR